MNRERQRRAIELFATCCERSPAERAAFLDQLCGPDAALRVQVEALLEFDARRPEFLAQRPSAPPARSPAEAEPARPLPERIGAFAVRGVLGEGGMGTVYEAEQEKPRRRVALKLLRGAATPDARRRFELESELLGRLDHPGIAKVLEAGSADLGGGWQPYFAMELVRGRSLTEYARAHGLALRARVELLAEVCDAVEHAHERGVIHRDLKPANVLVTDAGRPVVLDFGVARVTDSDLRATTLRTGAGQVIGTLPYMSPEQAGGDPAALDARADVYALGAIAYELLAGRLPIDLEGASIPEALRAIREDAPRAPSQFQPDLPGDLETVVLKALEKEPPRRYDSAAGLGADLRRWLRAEPVAARPPSTIYKLRKLAERNKALVGAACAVFVSLVAATAVSARAAVVASRQRDQAQREQKRADQRFADLHALTQKLLFDLHDQVETLAGATPVRELLVSTALEYLAKLSADAADDPALLADVAEAYARVGDIQGHPRRPNLGRTDDALASYGRSLELRDRLLALGVDPDRQAREKAILHQRIGAIRSATDSHAEALASYAQSTALLEPLASRPGSEVGLRSDLGAGYGLVGSTYEQMGRPEDALQAYRRVHELDEGLLAEQPGDKDLARSLSVSCNEVALMLERLGRLDEAEPYVLRALAVREELAAREPDNARARRDLALSRHRAGSLALKRDDAAAALAQFELALEGLRTLHEADPRDNRATFDLSVGHDKCAAALRKLGRHPEELEHLGTDLELREGLVRDNPENRFHASARASALEQIAGARLRTGSPRAAEDAWRRAIACADELLARAPDDAYAWTVVLIATFDLATHLLGSETGNESGLAEAVALLQRSLDARDAMEAQGIRPMQAAPARDEVAAALERARLPDAP